MDKLKIDADIKYTIYRYQIIQNLDCRPGFQQDILKLLEMKVDKMTAQEKECGLFIDELNLNAKVDYDQSTVPISMT